MIHVIATITLKEDDRAPFLAIFRENIPNVTAEEGCIRYEPAVDEASGLDAQGAVRGNVVTILETWESLDALRAHLKAPHMAAYRERVGDLVESVSLQVLKPAE